MVYKKYFDTRIEYALGEIQTSALVLINQMTLDLIFTYKVLTAC